MAKPVPVAHVPDSPAIPEETLAFYAIRRVPGGWDAHRLMVPLSWLSDSERIRDGDSPNGVIAAIQREMRALVQL